MTLEDAARGYAVRGWPILPVKPHGKEPQTRHGVKDATTDERTILHWWTRWPDANIGIACGAPGPTVLDVDRPRIARAALEPLGDLNAPTVATARGRHLYFAGEPRGTVALEYGELRGHGSYVIAPPSTHPTGKLYVWTLEPTGPLPKVPALFSTKTPAGAGVHTPRTEPVPHGQRHDHLKDMAIRLVRGGITDVPHLIVLLKAEYEAHCVKTPKAKATEFTALAEWAASTEIAQRERDPAKTKSDGAPGPDATLTEHRAYLADAGGWGPHIHVETVRRAGGRQGDGIEIALSNGLTIRFARQEHVTTRGHWHRTVIGCTNGIANPPQLKEPALYAIYRSLCVLADTPPEDREADDLIDAIGEYLSLCEPLTGHDLTDGAGRYDAIARCRARPEYDPRLHGEDAPKPTVIVTQDGARYIRGGEVRAYLNHQGIGISSADLPGRMHAIGLEHTTINGREPAGIDDRPRRKGRMILYQIP